MRFLSHSSLHIPCAYFYPCCCGPASTCIPVPPTPGRYPSARAMPRSASPFHFRSHTPMLLRPPHLPPTSTSTPSHPTPCHRTHRITLCTRARSAFKFARARGAAHRGRCWDPSLFSFPGLARCRAPPCSSPQSLGLSRARSCRVYIAVCSVFLSPCPYSSRPSLSITSPLPLPVCGFGLSFIDVYHHANILPGRARWCVFVWRCCHCWMMRARTDGWTD